MLEQTSLQCTDRPSFDLNTRGGPWVFQHLRIYDAIQPQARWRSVVVDDVLVVLGRELHVGP